MMEQWTRLRYVIHWADLMSVRGESCVSAIGARFKAPRIAHDTGGWLTDDGGRRWRPCIEELVYEAFYAFPATATTAAELEALKGKPQEEW